MRAAPALLLRAFVPLLLFGALVAIFGFGIGRDPSVIPSPLVGRQVPAFSAAKLHDAGNAPFVPGELRGETWLLNVWASWCASCLAEHAQIQWLADNGLKVVGLNYKDEDSAAKRWLAEHGDPFEFSVVDADGAIGIDFGVYGVPESFLVDPSGKIVHKHIGPIFAADAQKILGLSAIPQTAARAQ